MSSNKKVGHVDIKSDGQRNGSPSRVHSDCNGSRTPESGRIDHRRWRGECCHGERPDCSAIPAGWSSSHNKSCGHNRNRSRKKSCSRNRSRSHMRNCDRARSGSRNKSSSRNRSRSRNKSSSHMRNRSRNKSCGCNRSRSRNRSCSRNWSHSHMRNCDRVRSGSRKKSCSRMINCSHNKSCIRMRSGSRYKSCSRMRSCSHMRSGGCSGSKGRTCSGDGGTRRGRESRPKPDEQREDPEGSAPIPGPSSDAPPQRWWPRHPLCPPPFAGGPVNPGFVAATIPAHLPDSTTESWSGPCSHYGQDKSRHKGAQDKGFYDHGNDTLAVADMTSPAVMPVPPPPGVPPNRTATITHGRAPPGGSALASAANAVARAEPLALAAHGNRSCRSREQERRTWPLGASRGPLPKKPWMEKVILNNQHTLTVQKNSLYGNTKLEVCRIPRELNNIARLNEHFGVFGTVVNIQVAFDGDPEAAMIQYAFAGEARRAISSTEPVLKNRFVQVRWHRDGREREPRASPGWSYSAPSGPPHGSVCKAMATSVCLQKTTCSSSIIMSTPKLVRKVTGALEAAKAVKKKQEALKLQQDMARVKQKMLEKQIECQKVLIDRLERTRSGWPQERGHIVKTLRELSVKIGRLQEAMRSAPVPTTGPSGAVPAARLGLVAAGRKVSPLQDCGRVQGVEGRGGGGNLVVDHRPQKLIVLGVTNEDKKRDRRPQMLTILGVTNASEKKDSQLEPPTILRVTNEEKEQRPHFVELATSALLPDEDGVDDDDDADDDDDEDEHKSRSWRR